MVQYHEKQLHFFATQNNTRLLLPSATVNYKPQGRKQRNHSASIQPCDLFLGHTTYCAHMLRKVTSEGCYMRLIRVAVCRRLYKIVKSYY